MQKVGFDSCFKPYLHLLGLKSEVVALLSVISDILECYIKVQKINIIKISK